VVYGLAGTGRVPFDHDRRMLRGVHRLALLLFNRDIHKQLRDIDQNTRTSTSLVRRSVRAAISQWRQVTKHRWTASGLSVRKLTSANALKLAEWSRGTMFCIDALDECGREGDRKVLMQAVKGLLQSPLFIESLWLADQNPTFRGHWISPDGSIPLTSVTH